MVQYGCARATANKAVTALADAGLVERRRRAGTFVALPPVQTAALEIPELQAEITRRGQAYGFESLARRLASMPSTEADVARLTLEGDTLEIQGLHRADGRPFAWEYRVINLVAAPEARHASFEGTSPGGWLLEHVIWSEAEHRIRAVAAPAAVAKHLQLASGAACLELSRWTWRAGEGITFVRQVFPADAFALVARFSPPAFE